jgi:hypothetical protein
MRVSFFRICLIAAFAGSVVAQAQTRSVAITIDDGPAVNELTDLERFQRIARGLRSALEAEKAPATIFINERQLNVQGQRDGRRHPGRMARRGLIWASRYSPQRQQGSGVAVRGRPGAGGVIGAHCSKGAAAKWSGSLSVPGFGTRQMHQAILDFLEQRHYRVAHVTVKDYSFAGVYTRLLRSGDAETAEKVKAAYLEQVDGGFEHAEKASQEVFGREIPQILLIHCNELNSVTLRESIARMRHRGYRFVTLDEATKDEAYQRPDTFTGPGGSWLQRSARPWENRSQPPAAMPEWITACPVRGDKACQGACREVSVCSRSACAHCPGPIIWYESKSPTRRWARPSRWSRTGRIARHSILLWLRRSRKYTGSTGCSPTTIPRANGAK